MDPLKQYASTYEGKQDTDLATIQRGRQLIGILQNNSARFRGGLGLPAASLLAIGGRGGMNAIYITSEELAEAGFPDDKPIHLQLKIEQGPARPTGDDFGGDDANPFKTRNGIMLEVHDTLHVIESFNDAGLKRVFDEIEMAAGRIPLKTIPAAAFVPPVNPDPHVSQNLPPAVSAAAPEN